MKVAGVVAALAAEARALGPATSGALADGTLVAVSGIGPGAAAQAARSLIEGGATALVSWGMAGGLDPSLNAGALCVPHEVLAEDGERFLTDGIWREPLTARIAALHSVAGGALFSSAHAIDSVAGKKALRRATGAVAVDMESAAVAEAAHARGMPFLAVRAIVDTARDEVPCALVAAGLTGRIDIVRLLGSLARRPGDIAPLMRLSLCYRRAMRSLKAVASLGPLEPPRERAASA